MAQEQDAFRRLQAADPLRVDPALEPNLAGLTSRVQKAHARMQAASSSQSPLQVSPTSSPASSPASSLARRRWLRQLPAAVAAAIVIFGGGYLAGVGSHSGGSDAEVGQVSLTSAREGLTGSEEVSEHAEEELATEEYGGEAGALDEGAAPAPEIGIAGGDGSQGLNFVDRPVAFSARDLSTQAGVAPAYTFAAHTQFSAEVASRVAQAVGASGDVHTVETGLMRVGGEGGVEVSLYDDAATTLSIYAPARWPHYCGADDADAPVSSGVAPGLAPAIEPIVPGSIAPTPGPIAPTPESLSPTPEPCDQPDFTDGPAPDAAIDAVEAVLIAAGVAPSALASDQWRLEAHADSQLTQVTGYEFLPGGDTPVRMVQATVSQAGIAHLVATIAPVTALGDYPIVSAQAAVGRLGDSRYAYSGLPQSTSGGVEAAPEGSVVGTVSPGERLAWPLTTHELVSAILTHQVYAMADGAVVVLPTYEFVSDQGMTFRVIALADDVMSLN